MTDVGGLGLASHRLLENKVPKDTPRSKADQKGAMLPADSYRSGEPDQVRVHSLFCS